MPRRCCFSLWCLIAPGLLHLASFSAQALDPDVPPGQNFDLTHWYLGLPVDSSGGTSGDSASISAAQLVAGYSNALYFYTGADGAMTFWAPVDGATTPGSSYPRSELREQISPPDNNINWRGYGTHLLNATCKVTQVASTPKVIIGQIHTKTGDARPLVKLQYNNGTIEALVKHYASDTMPNTDNKLIFQNVGLNNSFDYTIQNENGLVTVTVNGLSKSTNTFLTDPDWANQEFYFKAGSYCQDNTGNSSEGARVAFYALSRSHAPSIINQPVSVGIAVGGTTNFGVSATGNGTLLYQWQHEGTNLSGQRHQRHTDADQHPTCPGGRLFGHGDGRRWARSPAWWPVLLSPTPSATLHPLSPVIPSTSPTPRWVWSTAAPSPAMRRIRTRARP